MEHWNPEDYAQNSSWQERWALELIDYLNLQENDFVLDIGCGDGRNSARLADQLATGYVLGVDSSCDMVEYARRHHEPSRKGKLRFAVENAAKLPYRDEFTAIFSNAALHWVKDHRPVLRGISQALKPGGRAVLQMGGYGNANEIIMAFDRVLSAPAWASWFESFELGFGFHRPEDYVRWSAEVGLDVDQIDLLDREMVFPDQKSFLGWLRNWHRYCGRVPEGLREQFLGEVISAYLDCHPKDEFGNISVRMTRLQALLSRH